MSTQTNKLGLFMLIALVTGNMVGSGVFMLPTELARIGSIGLLSWVFTSLGAMCLAVVFAKMSLLVPKTGGPYAYALAGFGEYIGFQTASYYWVVVWLGNVAVLVAFLGYLNVFFPQLEHSTTETVVGIAIIWALTVINILGVRFAGFVQIITTILKFIPLLLIAIIGWHYFHPEYLTNNFNSSHTSNFSAFSLAATTALWSFVGVESATVPADSVTNPQRNIPLATLIGTGIAAIIYLASSTAITGMLPHELLVNSTSPFADAANVIFGNWGKLLVAAGAAIACFGTLNGWILVGAQIPKAAAMDNLFPKFFAKEGRFNTPTTSLVISAILMSLLLIAIKNMHLLDQFQLLILITAVASLLAYFYTTIAEIILLAKEKIINYKIVLHIFCGLFAAFYTFWAIFGSGEKIIFYFTIFIFLTVPLYAWLKWQRRSTK